jgi:hypothetical protein
VRRGLIGMVAFVGLATGAGAQTTVGWDVPPNPLLPSRSLGALLQEPGEASGTVTESPKPSNSRYVLPVVASAIIPGMGEIVTGHWLRGLPFVAADVATWALYGHYENEGRDWRAAYESFADAHWHYDTWQQNLETFYDDPTQPNYDFWDPNNPPHNCTCPYITKEEDKQHYYENIGKYLYYYPGWDDWQWNGDPATADSRSHRLEYGHMRQESNANFDNSTNMIVVAMATRLASMVQTVLLMRNDTRNVEVRPMRLSGRGAGLRIAVRY